jgi:hypothetical protein
MYRRITRKVSTRAVPIVSHDAEDPVTSLGHRVLLFMTHAKKINVSNTDRLDMFRTVVVD